MHLLPRAAQAIATLTCIVALSACGGFVDWSGHMQSVSLRALFRAFVMTLVLSPFVMGGVGLLRDLGVLDVSKYAAWSIFKALLAFLFAGGVLIFTKYEAGQASNDENKRAG